MNQPPIDSSAAHHVRRMTGRDTDEAHRVSSPLELLFDLTFAAGFSLAGAQFAPLLAEGHFGAALSGFIYGMLAICWAWMGFSWFASAYDTDDWVFRIATMTHMVGVMVLALGLPRMFKSIDHGGTFDGAIMVLGYVIMRLALAFLMLRAANHDLPRRRMLLAQAGIIATMQAGWVLLTLMGLSVAQTFAASAVLGFGELAGPMLAYRLWGAPPWHAHHIAERFGLLAIIALGEGVAGTIASVSAIVQTQGWSVDAVMICAAGTGLTFGMWWIY